MKRKPKLEDIRVLSFITSEKIKYFRGGIGNGGGPDLSDIAPCSEDESCYNCTTG